MAVIQFNKGFQGLIDILKHFGVTVGVLTLKGFSELDEIRKTDSKRHSLTVAKVARKKIGRTSVGAKVARCWQQWITEGRVYRRGSGRPRNTIDREDRAMLSGHFGTNNVASIDSTPLTSLPDIQCHQDKPYRLKKSRRPLRRLPLTPHHRQCRFGHGVCDRLETCHLQ
ncbi:hypothetical protein TNCV_283681 [Trichonephila clavipes]|uniref:Uncharacterized protein n=1 Tax=Trichonephila clavipes TaxID=2585209 RepID=A0A8X6SIY8_TRICX|nr:hypothetical protein TNCV_283681 [Trichonephila clavipes]